MARRHLLFILLAMAYSPSQAQAHSKSPGKIQEELKKIQPDTVRANLLLELALSFVFKPGEYTTDLDTALVLVKQAEGLNQSAQSKKLQAKAFFVYSNALREGGRTGTGKQYIEKSLAVFRTISDPADMAEAWLELSNYYSGEHYAGLTQKRECLEKALPLFKEAGNYERQADVLKILGDLSQFSGLYVQAMKELREALAIYLSIGYKNLQGVYDLMGTVLSDMADYAGAVKYGLLALKTAESQHDTTMQLCTIYNRLAISYANWSKSDEVEKYLKKAMQIAVKYNDRNAIELIMLSLSLTLSDLHKEGESIKTVQFAEASITKPWHQNDSLLINIGYLAAYVRAGLYKKAEKFAIQVILLLKGYTKGTRPSQAYDYLIFYFMGIHDYNNARKYAADFLNYAVSIDQKRIAGTAYRMLSKVDSAIGNFKTALSDYQAYKKIMDSALNETTSFQFAQMQVEYETEKKDNDIKLLKQGEQIQQAKLVQTRTVNSIIIIGIIVLSLLLALVYARYRTNQLHNRQLETKQQEINEKNSTLEHLITDKDNLIADKDGLLKEKDWLVKEIHHRVKNNLQMVISLLNAQSEFLNNPKALEAIRESRERMQAIAIIHQKLHQVDNSAQINMRSYISELVDNIKSSVVDSGRICFQIQVADIDLDISQSVPLGLILNEAITNAIKYAYRKNGKGEILISLKNTGSQQVQLKIADRGKGLPAGLDTDHSNSLGLQLINLFSEQLDGDLFFINHNGLEIILNFKTAEYKSTVANRVTA